MTEEGGGFGDLRFANANLRLKEERRLKAERNLIADFRMPIYD